MKLQVIAAKVVLQVTESWAIVFLYTLLLHFILIFAKSTVTEYFMFCSSSDGVFKMYLYFRPF